MAKTENDQHANPKSDLEIAQKATMLPIQEVAADKLGIGKEHLEFSIMFEGDIRPSAVIARAGNV